MDVFHQDLPGRLDTMDAVLGQSKGAGGAASRGFRIANEARRAGRRRSGASALVGLVLALIVALTLACESPALRTLRGSRLYVSGTEALDRGDTTLAIADLEEAATLAPAASEIRNHLGLAYWQAGDAVRARIAFEAAIDRDCENEAARANLARLDATVGRPDGARPKR